MGIRLNKVIGYGLTDVKTEDGRIADPRINNDSFWIYGKEPEQPYGEWLKARLTGDEADDIELLLELAMMEEAKEGATDAYHACSWDRGERAREKVLLVRPVGFTQWHRYGDVIDTQEEYALYGDDADNRLVMLPDGIFPFSVLYMDARTGRRIDSQMANTWQAVARNKKSDAEQRAKALKTFAKALGFKSHAEARRHVAPLVPEEVRRVCEWAGLFADPDAWLQLRPMLYTYLS